MGQQYSSPAAPFEHGGAPLTAPDELTTTRLRVMTRRSSLSEKE